MTKILTLVLALASFLDAQAITQDQQNDIYKEAILFVIIFGVMGIISFIYSKKHAKAYVPKKVVIEPTAKELASQKRIEELKKMLDDKTLTSDEFMVLKEYYLT